MEAVNQIMNLDPAAALVRADELASAFRSAEPFPHVVLENFLPEDLAQSVVEEFPTPEEMGIQFKSGREFKSANEDWTKMRANTRTVLGELNSGPIVEFLERLTGIAPLLTDPHLLGGGQHQIQRGGKLAVHSDFETHPRLHVRRAVNLLIYLNRDWDDEWGGRLELWDAAMTHAVERISPVFNRAVIFTTSGSCHGHPDPLQSPPGVTRKSLALYYYSAPHDTGEETPSSNGTGWFDRPGTTDQTIRRAEHARAIIRCLVPPIVITLMHKVTGRIVASTRSDRRS